MRKLLITEPFRKSDLDKIRSSLPEDFEITQIQDFTEDQLRTQLKTAEIVIGEPIVLPLTLILEALGICGKSTEYTYLVLLIA